MNTAERTPIVERMDAIIAHVAGWGDVGDGFLDDLREARDMLAVHEDRPAPSVTTEIPPLRPEKAPEALLRIILALSTAATNSIKTDDAFVLGLAVGSVAQYNNPRLAAMLPGLLADGAAAVGRSSEETKSIIATFAQSVTEASLT